MRGLHDPADALFSNTTSAIDESRDQVQELRTGSEFKAFQVLEGVSALQPGTSEALAADLQAIELQMFLILARSPRTPSMNSFSEDRCIPAALRFANAADKVGAAAKGADQGGEDLRRNHRQKAEHLPEPIRSGSDWNRVAVKL